MRGQKIDIPIHSDASVQDVVPGAFSQNTPDTQVSNTSINLNYWRESAFTLSDKDLLEIMEGVPNKEIETHAKALANDVNSKLLQLYKKTWNFYGTPGVTPFATDVTPAPQVRKILKNNLAPSNDLRMVLDTDTEANVLALPAFAYYLNSGDTNQMREGQMGRKYGFDWYSDQQMVEIYHNAGTLSGATTSAAPVTVTATPVELSKGTVTLAATNGQTVKVGDIFTVAGDRQSYVLQADATVSGGAVTVQFAPAPAVAWANGSAVTLRGSHQNSLAFHKEAIALAIRPFAGEKFGTELGGGQSLTMVDPISGIPLRLEVIREYKRVRWSMDLLFGLEAVRPQHMVRLVG